MPLTIGIVTAVVIMHISCTLFAHYYFYPCLWQSLVAIILFHPIPWFVPARVRRLSYFLNILWGWYVAGSVLVVGVMMLLTDGPLLPSFIAAIVVGGNATVFGTGFGFLLVLARDRARRRRLRHQGSHEPKAEPADKN